MPELQTQHRFLRVCWNKLDCKKSGPLCDRGERMSDVVIHGLELVINDKQISEEHKKFLTYLKQLLEEEE